MSRWALIVRIMFLWGMIVFFAPPLSAESIGMTPHSVTLSGSGMTPWITVDPAVPLISPVLQKRKNPGDESRWVKGTTNIEPVRDLTPSSAQKFFLPEMWEFFGSADESKWYWAPSDVAVDPKNNVYVLDSYNRVSIFSSTGRKLLGRYWLTSSTNFADLAADKNGNFFIIDGNTIKKYSKSGKLVQKWGKKGAGIKQFNSPQGLAVDYNGNVYVADTGNHRVQVFSSAGTYLKQWRITCSKHQYHYRPTKITINKAGTIFLQVETKSGWYCIVRVSKTGKVLQEWDFMRTNLNYLYDVAVDNSGVCYALMLIGDPNTFLLKNSAVMALYRDGTKKIVIDKYSFTSYNPLLYSLAVDSKGDVYIIDANDPYYLYKFTNE